MERNPYRPPQAPVADATGHMSRVVVVLATVLLGIVPATLELLLTALQYWTLSAGIPEGVVVIFQWRQVVEQLLVVTGVLAGYVALFFAARGRVNGPVAVALAIGAIAMAYAAVFGSAYWLALSAVVAAIHAAYYVLFRRREVQEHAQGAA